MLGLFGTLNLAARSLAVQQQGTEVAGQNLANVNNAAYARQQLVIKSATPLATPIGQEGNGVTAVAIIQVRDALLDNQIQSQGSVTGSLGAQQLALQNAEAGLGEQISGTNTNSTDSSPNGLTADLSSFFNAFQGLSADPANLAKRQTVIASAQQLSGQFNQVSNRMSTLRTSLNSAIQSGVDSANQDLGDIARLNQQIVAAQQRGGHANDLIDLRQQKLEDLAGKTNFTSTAQPNGAVDVTIGGVTMVSGQNNVDTLQTYDAGGGQILVRAQTAGTPVNVIGGSIGGNIDVRDGALASLQKSVDTLAANVIAQVNTIHSGGYDLNGTTGRNFFEGIDAASMGVNSAIANDPAQLQASGSAAATGDNSVALALAQLANNKISGLNNQTFSDNYSQTVSNLGSSLASVNDQIANNGAVTTMLNQQRTSISGVSVDEEMTNLIQFQKAYQASAELITTINQMLATVIAMKTV